jgi:hypothetical protein
MDWGREMAFINHFYFNLWDSEWGAAFFPTLGEQGLVQYFRH